MSYFGVEEGLFQVQGECKGSHEGAGEGEAGPPVLDDSGGKVRDRLGSGPREAPEVFLVLVLLFFFSSWRAGVGIRLDAEKGPNLRREGLERVNSRVAARVIGPRECLAVVDRLGRVDALRARGLVAVEVGRLPRVGEVLDVLGLTEEGQAPLVGGVGDGTRHAVVADVEEAVVGRRCVDLAGHGLAVFEEGAEDARDVDYGYLGRGCVAWWRAEDGAVYRAVARGELQLEGVAIGLWAGLWRCFLDGHILEEVGMNELVVAMEIKTNSGFNGLELPRLWGGPPPGVGEGIRA